MQESSSIASFYTKKSVFITGGTGFLGKTLIEKLVYSCSGIDKIYVLVRDKSGKQARERLARIIGLPVFERLRNNRPADLKKIIAVAGDVSEMNLGLSDDMLKCLEEDVSIVFHLAATVNFNVPLKEALQINVNGTQEVIQLCRRMRKLQALIHVSTAFSNSDRSEIDEIVYPLPVSLDHALKIAELYSDDEKYINKFLGKKPNTYAYSKAFAEEVIMRECRGIPAAIIRPSIVISSLKDPCPGWIDSWSGSVGLFVGMPAGVLKVVLGRGTNVTDLVPVDIVTNLIIVAATQCQSSKETRVYNCCSGNSNPITCDGASYIARKVTLRHSLNKLPFPFLIFTSSRILYEILTFLLQIIPALIIDVWSYIRRKKVTQFKLQMKLRKIVHAVKFFLLNQWRFSDDNMKKLQMTMSPRDREEFNFDVKTINWEECLQDYVLGARKYLVEPQMKQC